MKVVSMFCEEFVGILSGCQWMLIRVNKGNIQRQSATSVPDQGHGEGS